MMFQMAERNNLMSKLPFKTEEEAQKAFEYKNLQEFLDLRDASLQVFPYSCHSNCIEVSNHAIDSAINAFLA